MITKKELQTLETELNSTDQTIRRDAVAEAQELLRCGKIPESPPGRLHNMHCHTTFSHNTSGYSPSFIAYLARKSGWLAAGIIDSDVLDAIGEFREAAELFDLNYSCGIETRVTIPELAGNVINSPGEPGIAYHLGLGFDTGNLPPCSKGFAFKLRARADGRARDVVKAVNSYLAPVRIDYRDEVIPKTPNGNATERHLCHCYRLKAEALYPDTAAREKFWAEKLHLSPEEAKRLIATPPELEATIRFVTMKQGGAGYLPPTTENYPHLEDFNRFLESCGALPVVAWLNGLSTGEADVDRLLDLHLEKGAVMLSIIPERNCLSGRCREELDRIVAGCAARDLPIVIGTEMNAPGQKLVNDIDSPDLEKHAATFVTGARIISAHTQLAKLRRGYQSSWAKRELPDRRERNRFYARLGEYLSPARFDRVRNWPESAGEILRMIDFLENDDPK